MIDSQKMKTSYKQLTENFRVILLALVLTAGISYVYAWTGPTQAPPEGNVSAPINVGVIDQIKDAGLGVNVLAVFGQGSFGGEVIIGSTGATCDADLEGAIRYDSGTQCLQLCANDAWGDIQCGVASSGGGSGGLTITEDAYNYNVAEAAGSPTTADNFTVTIASGIKVGSTSTTLPAFTTGNLPAGSTVTIVNHGRIEGKGGNGAAANTFGEVGLPGGNALNLTVATTINNTDGEIWSGGGGGGGGVSYFLGGEWYNACGGGGGGGGAGFDPGLGVMYHPGQPQWNYLMGPGANGTTEVGGAGSGDPRGPSCSNQRGGNGGNPGEAGDPSDNNYAGGVAGKAIVKNGNTLTWANQGSVRGAIE